MIVICSSRRVDVKRMRYWLKSGVFCKARYLLFRVFLREELLRGSHRFGMKFGAR